MFTDQRETMAHGNQVSLLVPMNQTWPMCFRGDQSEFGPIRARRWKHSLTPHGVGLSCAMDLHEGKIEGQCLNFVHNLHSSLRSSCDTPNEENVSTSRSRDPLARWIEKDRWGRASHIRLIRLEDGGRCRYAWIPVLS